MKNRSCWNEIDTFLSETASTTDIFYPLFIITHHFITAACKVVQSLQYKQRVHVVWWVCLRSQTQIGWCLMNGCFTHAAEPQVTQDTTVPRESIERFHPYFWCCIILTWFNVVQCLTQTHTNKPKISAFLFHNEPQLTCTKIKLQHCTLLYYQCYKSCSEPLRLFSLFQHQSQLSLTLLFSFCCQSLL